MPVRYRQSSSPQAAVIPAALADPGLQRWESISCWEGAQQAMEPWRDQPLLPQSLGSLSPSFTANTQMLGQWVANTFPSLASLNRKREVEETAGEQGAVPAWPYIPPQHLSSCWEGNK